MQQGKSSWFLGVKKNRFPLATREDDIICCYESRALAVPVEFIEAGEVVEDLDSLLQKYSRGTKALYEKLKDKEFVISTVVDDEKRWIGYEAGEFVLGAEQDKGIFRVEYEEKEGHRFVRLIVKGGTSSRYSYTLVQSVNPTLWDAREGEEAYGVRPLKEINWQSDLYRLRSNTIISRDNSWDFWQLTDKKHLMNGGSGWFLGYEDGKLIAGKDLRNLPLTFEIVEEDDSGARSGSSNEDSNTSTDQSTPEEDEGQEGQGETLNSLALYERFKDKEFVISTQVDGKQVWLTHASSKEMQLGSFEDRAVFTIDYKEKDGKKIIYLKTTKEFSGKEGFTLAQEKAGSRSPRERVWFNGLGMGKWASWQLIDGKYLKNPYSEWYLTHRNKKLIAKKGVRNMPLTFKLNN